MNSLRFIIFLILVFVYNPVIGGTVIIQGKIENKNSNQIIITNYFTEYSIQVKPDGTFNDTIKLIDGYYSFNDGKEQTSIFLEDGYNLFITLNTKMFDETIKYKGKGSEHNNFLADKALYSESIAQLKSPYRYSSLDEQEFLSLIDSVFNLESNLLNANKAKLSPSFFTLEYNDIKYEMLQSMLDFPAFKNYFNKDTKFTVSDSYPKLQDSISVNSDLFKSRYYSRFKNNVLYNNYLNYSTNKDTSDNILGYLKIIDSLIPNQNSKDNFLVSSYSLHLRITKKPIEYHNILYKLISNNDYKLEIEKRLEILLKTQKGMPSPQFEFANINGEKVKLSDYLGKVVYIDIWATWCQPCLREIPHLKTVKEEFKDKNIVFIGVAWGDKLEIWKNFVEKQELGVNQFFADGENDSFFKAYDVNGIPRFILIDEEGNIINPDAPRPSNDQLVKILNEILNK